MLLYSSVAHRGWLWFVNLFKPATADLKKTNQKKNNQRKKKRAVNSSPILIFSLIPVFFQLREHPWMCSDGSRGWHCSSSFLFTHHCGSSSVCWFCAAESSLILRTQMDPPGQDVTNFPPFPQLVFYAPFPPPPNLIIIWGEAAVQRHQGIAVWIGGWVQGEDDPKPAIWAWWDCGCPGKNVLDEKSLGQGRGDSSSAAGPWSPFQHLSPTCSRSRASPAPLHRGCTSHQTVWDELCSHCCGCTEHLGEAGKEERLTWPLTLRSGHSNQKWR